MRNAVRIFDTNKNPNETYVDAKSIVGFLSEKNFDLTKLYMIEVINVSTKKKTSPSI